MQEIGFPTLNQTQLQDRSYTAGGNTYMDPNKKGLQDAVPCISMAFLVSRLVFGSVREIWLLNQGIFPWRNTSKLHFKRKSLFAQPFPPERNITTISSIGVSHRDVIHDRNASGMHGAKSGDWNNQQPSSTGTSISSWKWTSWRIVMEHIPLERNNLTWLTGLYCLDFCI